MRKKQVLAVVSIAVMSFLVGTLFNMNFTVLGGKGKDKDEDLWKAISDLQSKVETLEEQSLPEGFLTAPAYDSGWVLEYSGTMYKTFEHGLNTTNVFVYIVRNNTVRGINQEWYWSSHHPLIWFNLTENEITLENPSMQFASGYVRVIIWKISEPPT